MLQNNPLFLESFLERRTEDDVLRFSYIVHCALDAIEERGMDPDDRLAPTVTLPAELFRAMHDQWSKAGAWSAEWCSDVMPVGSERAQATDAGAGCGCLLGIIVPNGGLQDLWVRIWTVCRGNERSLRPQAVLAVALRTMVRCKHEYPALRRYITNTKVKLVLVIAINVTNYKDDDLIAVRLILPTAWGQWQAGASGAGTNPATERLQVLSVAHATALSAETGSAALGSSMYVKIL